jgi:hypothetical protein
MGMREGVPRGEGEMGKVVCEKCFEAVGDTADACPNCGHSMDAEAQAEARAKWSAPRPASQEASTGTQASQLRASASQTAEAGAKKSSPIIIFGGGFLALCFVAPCIAGLFGAGGDSHDEIDAYVMAQQFVTRRLRSPSTADFPTYDESFVTSHANSEYTVRAYVDAQNAFGATIRTRFRCRLRYAGDDSWQLVSINVH